MTVRSLVLLPLLLLSSCVITPPPAKAQCDASAAQTYLGMTATANVAEAARKTAGATTVRTLKPGQVVTMEFLEGRLNLYVDANGKIERIACG